jgi:hypothetical protein
MIKFGSPRPVPRRPFKLSELIPLEKDEQKTILSLLRVHPAVAWAARFNSGSAWLKCAGGRYRPVEFNTLEGCPDILGQLKNGRFLAIEVKRRGWKKPKDARERAQASFLQLAGVNGGLAFFATSAEEVKSMLDQGWF